MATTKSAAEKPTKPRRPPPKAAKADKGITLVVVESPAKAKTIKKYLGSGYTVKASVGHVMDLPKSKMGVDIENGFEPEYEVIEAKKKVVAEIKSAAKLAVRVLLATDPDREGEAIAWHVFEQIRSSKVPTHRGRFNELTTQPIQDAIPPPQALNKDM